MEQTDYRCANTFGCMEVFDTKRLKALEKESPELKKMISELTLYDRMLKDVVLER